MHSVMNVPGSHTRSAHLAQPNRHAVVHTTLYDLIEAMHEVIAADEDERVVQAIVHLFDTGRIVFRTAAANHTLPPPPAGGRSREHSGHRPRP